MIKAALVVVVAVVEMVMARVRTLTPDQIYGSGPLFEQRVKDHHGNARLLQGLGTAEEKFYTQKVNHFNASDSRTFQQRYLIDSTYYKEATGPIIFYAGNEGGIWAFYNNSGFMSETLAKKFGALVVFAEHRYYGSSKPFGDQSLNKTAGNVQYLTIPNVLADFVDLVNYLKAQDPTLKNKAVIVGGGSYGGVLAAWLRIKYPHVFQGALASSATVRWFRDTVLPTAFDTWVSKIVKQIGGQECFDLYKDGFFDLASLKYDFTKYAKLKEIFNLCNAPTTPDDIDTLIGTASDAIGTTAMVNYPYPTDFLNPLPAWPLKEGCTRAKTVPKSSEPAPSANDVSSFNFSSIEALQRSANLFYNFTGKMKCLDISKDN